MSPADVLKLCKEKRVEFFDLRFMDFPGLWQHTTCPINELTLESFNHGFGFDGSSIRGWQAINESDMLLVPVASTAKIDPFMTHSTLSIICDVRDPITKKEYSRDPRSIARKAAAYLKKSKIADTAYFGPELEFLSSIKRITTRGLTSENIMLEAERGSGDVATKMRATLATR
jgi:glutamine synthetase